MGPRGGLGGGWNGSRDSFQPLQARSRKNPGGRRSGRHGGDSGDQIESNFALSRDGTRLAILYRELDDPAAVAEKLAVMPADGRLPVRVFRTPGKISTLRWSPDGKALQYKLRVFYEAMPPTFGKSRPTAESQSSFSSGRIFDFTWSADGKQLLLIRGDVVVVSNSL